MWFLYVLVQRKSTAGCANMRGKIQFEIFTASEVPVAYDLWSGFMISMWYFFEGAMSTEQFWRVICFLDLIGRESEITRWTCGFPVSIFYFVFEPIQVWVVVYTDLMLSSRYRHRLKNERYSSHDLWFSANWIQKLSNIWNGMFSRTRNTNTTTVLRLDLVSSPRIPQ